MHKLLILFFGLIGVGWVQAQSLSPEVIASAGNHFSGTHAQMSWTLGEAVIETYSAQLTQGFHQTNLIIVGVDDPVADFPVRVYPNPTSGWVSIEAQPSAPAFSVELSNAQGRILLSRTATGPQGLPHTLDLSGYAPGLYLLRLRNQDSKTILSYKILKNN